MNGIRSLFLPLLMLACLASTATAYVGDGHKNKTVCVVNHSDEVAQLRADVGSVDVPIVLAVERVTLTADRDVQTVNTMHDGAGIAYMDFDPCVLSAGGSAKKAGPMCILDGAESVAVSARMYLDMIDRSDDAPTARLRC